MDVFSLENVSRSMWEHYIHVILALWKMLKKNTQIYYNFLCCKFQWKWKCCYVIVNYAVISSDRESKTTINNKINFVYFFIKVVGIKWNSKFIILIYCNSPLNTCIWHTFFENYYWTHGVIEFCYSQFLHPNEIIYVLITNTLILALSYKSLLSHNVTQYK